ncbi:MAG: class I SAM-dependent methyltransferase [Bryobacteraceae bacterium]
MNAELYQSDHSFVWKYGEGLLPLLAPREGEWILDVGCGTGELTAKIAAAGAHVVGVDLSADMIAKARAQHPGIEWVNSGVVEYQPEREFDAVFSNAALHWVHDADGAVTTIARALRPGGRFVAEFGGAGNCQAVTGATGVHPWYFPSIGEYAPILERHGFEVSRAELYDRWTELEDPVDGLKNWIRMFGKGMPQDDESLEKLQEQLRPVLFRDGKWWMDYRRIRVVALKRT